MKNNRVLIILGMHRSGTSLTAQWLDTCGLKLGNRLLGSDFSNTKGHIEDLDFLELNKLILQSNNLSETGLKGDLSKIIFDDYLLNRIKSLCQFKNELNEQWGWKEPRTCLFINEYLKYLPEAKVLVIFRDLSKVRTSLIKRDIKRLKRDIKKSSLVKRVKWRLFSKRYIRRLVKTKNEQYLKTNIYYHQLLVNFIENHSQGTMVVCNIDNLKTRDQVIFNKLVDMGFTLKNINFSSVFDPLLFDERNSYIINKNKMTDEEKVLFDKLTEYEI
ncbi:hypothetical protein [Lutimonas zeaxanthinifaciens]|uniref:hypothetical protein n=1 Tax=Lutimonas zeaxanthinifaciens TaxID=3060215 RepID=UPI00265CD7A6|nr:hypothetical protein [Lutimonas sp. YSD2104]WKK67346.1 hypothetical protein QZH61_06890 [Lutimonas sp. YSD2104]